MFLLHWTWQLHFQSQFYSSHYQYHKQYRKLFCQAQQDWPGTNHTRNVALTIPITIQAHRPQNALIIPRVIIQEYLLLFQTKNHWAMSSLTLWWHSLTVPIRVITHERPGHCINDNQELNINLGNADREQSQSLAQFSLAMSPLVIDSDNTEYVTTLSQLPTDMLSYDTCDEEDNDMELFDINNEYMRCVNGI